MGMELVAVVLLLPLRSTEVGTGRSKREGGGDWRSAGFERGVASTGYVRCNERPPSTSWSSSIGPRGKASQREYPLKNRAIIARIDYLCETTISFCMLYTTSSSIDIAQCSGTQTFEEFPLKYRTVVSTVYSSIGMTVLLSRIPYSTMRTSPPTSSLSI